MRLLRSLNLVEIESTFDQEGDKDMSETSRAYSDTEVESDDQGFIFTTLSKDRSCIFAEFQADLS